MPMQNCLVIATFIQFRPAEGTYACPKLKQTLRTCEFPGENYGADTFKPGMDYYMQLVGQQENTLVKSKVFPVNTTEIGASLRQMFMFFQVNHVIQGV